MTIEDKLITIEELISYCKNEQLHKPCFQRDKQWNYKQNSEFLKFTFSMQHILTPFLCTKNIVSADASSSSFSSNSLKEVYSIFDGNNRINALFEFERCPLLFLENAHRQLMNVFAGREGGDEIFKLIKSFSYTEVYNITSLREICKSSDSTWSWYKMNDDKDDSIETAYHAYHSELVKIRFNQIKLSLKIFSNLPFETIVNIFKNINTSGVKLSTQDILKATCSLTLYEAHEINEFGSILALNQAYIDEQNQKELLAAPIPERQLSTFQILFGLQLQLNKQYPFIVEEPGNADLDLIFKLYQSFYPDINQKNVANMNHFIEKVKINVALLQRIYERMFGIVFSERGLHLIPRGVNKLCILMFHMMLNEWNMIDLTKVILYNRLCVFLSNHDLENKMIFESKNPLPYQANGNLVEVTVNKMKRGESIGKIPSYEDMRKLFEYLIPLQQNPCAFSQKKTQYKPIALEILMINMYYYSRIPRSFHETPMHLDHIIPSALRGWTGEIDINRIGNRMLIPKSTNLRKSNRQVTTDFLVENKMTSEYFNYITEEEYKKIVRNDVAQKEAYDVFCEKREKTYLDGIMEYLYPQGETTASNMF